MNIEKKCEFCNKSFLANISELKRGFAKFCCKKCGQEARKGKKIFPANVICSFCKNKFYLSDSKRKNSKSGLFFCKRLCKDSAQKIGGIKQIQPKHYKTGIYTYHKKAISFYGNKCQKCGYDELPICIVHHIDRNRNNNKLDNLQVLCGRCHDIEHYLAKDGRFKNKGL